MQLEELKGNILPTVGELMGHMRRTLVEWNWKDMKLGNWKEVGRLLMEEELKGNRQMEEWMAYGHGLEKMKND